MAERRGRPDRSIQAERSARRRGPKARRFAALLAIGAVITGLWAIVGAQAAAPATACYAVSGATSTLTYVFKDDLDPATNEVTIGNFGAGVGAVGGIALDSASGILYAINDDRSGTVDVDTGAFSPLALIGSGNGSVGSVTFNSITGLATQAGDPYLYATMRRTSGPDLLLKIDKATGKVVQDGFGSDEYVEIPTFTSSSPSAVLDDVADISFNPFDGTLYAIVNNGGSGVNDRLMKIDTSTGALSDVGLLGEPEMEGLSFDGDGRLFAVRSDVGQFYEVDPTTGAVGAPHPIDNATDYVALACNTARANRATGKIFNDLDNDGVRDSGESVSSGVEVYLYDDADGDGRVEVDEVPVATTRTDAAGSYEFNRPETGKMIVIATADGLPIHAHFTAFSRRPIDFGGATGQTVTNDFGWLTAPAGADCFLVADDQNLATTVLKDAPSPLDSETALGLTGVDDIEGIAYDDLTATVYAVDGVAGKLGTLDQASGDFTPYPQPVGNGSGAAGTKALDNIDSLAVDPFSGELWGVDANSPYDVLFQIDKSTGQRVPNVFGAAVDYVELVPSAMTSLGDVDDIAISPIDGRMYAIANNAGIGDQLAGVNTRTGELTLIGAVHDSGGVAIEDVEGLAFDARGNLYATKGGANNNGTLFTLDVATGQALTINPIRIGSDYESIACPAAATNRISGTIFADANGNGNQDPGEAGTGSVAIRLWRDADGDGRIGGGDTLLSTTTTAPAGSYAFTLPATGKFIVQASAQGIPVDTTFTGGSDRPLDLGSGFAGDVSINFGYAQADFCWVGASGVDLLTRVVEGDTNPLSNQTTVGSFDSPSRVAALEYDIITDTLYGVQQGEGAGIIGFLGTINQATGHFTAKAAPIGKGDGVDGRVALDAPESLALDPYSQRLWAVQPRATGPDLLFAIDPASGVRVADLFGVGVDYVEIGTAPDTDAVAVSPIDRTLYALQSSAGTNTVLARIDPANGAVTSSVGLIDPAAAPIPNVKGLDFDASGAAWLLTGRTPLGAVAATDDGMFSLDPATGIASNRQELDNATGFDSLVCGDGAPNTIDGYVYRDDDRDGVKDGGEPGTAAVTVRLYRDLDGDGVPDPNEPLLDTDLSGSDGHYRFSFPATGRFVVEVRAADLPAGHAFTGIGTGAVDFGTGFGQSASRDFGHVLSVDLDINKTDSTDPAPVGVPFSYDIRVRDLSISDGSGVVVTDSLPANLQFQSATSSQGSCAAAGQLVTCNLGTVVAGSQVGITLNVRPQLCGCASIINTATVAGAELDPDLTNNQESETTAIGPPPPVDLAVDKVLSSGVAAEGRRLGYTITATNNGQFEVASVSVRDQIPSELSFVSATVSGSGGTCSPPSGGGPLICDLGAMNSGESKTIDLEADLGGSLPAQIANTATISAPVTDPVPANNSSTATVTTVHPQLNIDKDVSGDPEDDDLRPTEPGDAYVYTLDIVNSGTGPAYDVVVDDLPDSALRAVIETDGQAFVTDAWNNADPDIRWVIPGPIDPGGSVRLRYTAELASTGPYSAGQAVSNSADISSYFETDGASRAAQPTETFANHDDVSADQVQMTVAIPSLAIAKTTGAQGFPESAAAAVGTPFAWRVVITNNSGAVAHGVDLHDVLPAGWNYRAGSAQLLPGGSIEPTITPSGSGDALDWTDLTNLAPGETLTLDLDATPTAAAANTTGTGASNPHLNNASATWIDGAGYSLATSGPYSGGPDSAEAILGPFGDVAISKVHVLGQPIEGHNLTFQITATASSVNATNVVARDALPPELSYVSVAMTSGSGSCSAASNIATCNLGSIPANTSESFRVVARLGPNPPATVTNTATVSADTDLDPTNSSADAVVATVRPQLTIDKFVSGDPDLDDLRDTQPGDSYTFTLRLTNIGTVHAHDILVTDLPDAELRNVNIAAAAAGVTVTDNWTAGDPDIGLLVTGPISPGQSRDITYTARLTGTGPYTDGQQVTNSADITAYYADTAANRAAQPGFPWTAFNDVLADDLSMTIRLPNLAVVKTTGLAGFPDLGTAGVGSSFPWWIRVTNNGPALASAPVIRDILPPDWRYDNGSALINGTTQVNPTRTANSAGDRLDWSNIGDLAPGASLRIDFTATPRAAALVSGGTGASNPHTNTATVRTYDDADGNAIVPSPAPSDLAQAILPPPTSDLSLTKTLASGSPIEGGRLTYQIDLANAGPDLAPNTIVSDQLPTGLSFVSASVLSGGGNCSENGAGLVTCDLGDLAVGTTPRIAIIARVDASPPATIDNTATIASDSSDPNLADDASSVSLTTQRPQVMIDKDISGDPDDDDLRDTQPGDTYTYTVTATNTGAAPAYDIRVADQPDPELTNVVLTGGAAAATDSWSAADPDIVWVVAGPLAPGASTTLRYTASLIGSGSLSEGEQVDNVATVGSYFAASTAARGALPGFAWTNYNDGGTDSVALTVRTPALALTKTTGLAGFPDSGPASVNDSFGWRIVATNTSGAAATGVDIDDLLPPDWDYVAGSAQLNPGGQVEPTVSADPSGERLVWSNAADLAPGQNLVIDFAATPRITAASGTGFGPASPHINTASADFRDGAGAAASAAGNYLVAPDGAEAILAQPSADLAVSKTLSGGVGEEGETLTYRIDVTNQGTDPALASILSDQLPPQLRYGAAAVTQGSGSCNEDGNGLIRCDLGVINPGATRTVTVSADIGPAPPGSIANTATAVTGSLDSDPSNDSDTASLTVERPQITIDKDVSGDPDGDDIRSTEPGDSYTYVLTVRNTGAARAYDVHVIDQPGPGLTGVALGNGAGFNTDSWSAADPDIAWVIPGPIAPGTAFNLRYTARLAPSATLSNGQTVRNSADADRYFGASTAKRAANPGLGWGTYDDVTPDDVTLNVATPALSVDKTTGLPGFQDSANASVADPFPWRITITNSSQATARNVDALDTLPADWDYLAGSANLQPSSGPAFAAEPTINPAAGGDRLGWSNAVDLAPGESLRIDFEATPTIAAAIATGTGAANPHVNRADASFDDASGAAADAAGPYDPASDSAEALLDLPSQDLSIRKTHSAGRLEEGETITYTLDVTNRGTDPAGQVVVTDSLSSALGFVDAAVTVGGGSCADDGSGNVGCDLGTLDPGQTKTIEIAAEIGPAPPASIDNSAEVSGFGNDSDPANNSDSVAVNVARPLLAIDKTVSGDPDGDDRRDTEPADRYTFTLAVTNNGGARAYDVRVDDLPDAELEAVALSGGAAFNVDGWSSADPDLGWVIPGPIAPGASVRLTYRADLVASDTLNDGELVENSAAITGYLGVSSARRAQDPGFSWNTYSDAPPDSVSMTAQLPRLTVSKTTGQAGFGESGAAAVDSPFPWRITIANNSAATARNVSLNDVLPAGWDYVAGSTVISPAPGGSVEPTVSADPGGDRLDWSDIGDIAPGASIVVDLRSTPTTDAIEATGSGAGNPHQNVARAGFEDAAGATADATGPYAAGPDGATAIVRDLSTDLAISKDLIAGIPAEGRFLTYSLHIENRGPDPAIQTTVSDQLPANLQFVAARVVSSSGGSCAADSNDLVSCELGVVRAGSRLEIQIDARVGANPGSQIVNSAAVATGAVDSNPANDSASVTTDVQRPQLTIDKQISGDPDGDDSRDTEPGDGYTYSVVITNNGGAAAHDIRVIDQPDDVLRAVVVAAPGPGVAILDNWTASDPDIAWMIHGPLAPGASITLRYAADLAPSNQLHEGEAVANTATLDSYYGTASATRASEPSFGWSEYVDGGEDSVTAAVRLPHLRIEKTTGLPSSPDSGAATVDQSFPWRIVITNDSGANAKAPQLNDTLPAGWSYDTASAVFNPGGPIEPVVVGDSGGDELIWDLPEIAPGERVVITYSATPTIEAAASLGTGGDDPHTNLAEVVFSDAADAIGSGDGNYLGGPDAATAIVGDVVSDLGVTIRRSDDQVVAGLQFEYIIEVTNHGPIAAYDPHLTDTIPTGLQIRLITTDSGDCSLVSRQVSCDLGPLAAGETATIVVAVTVNEERFGDLEDGAAVSDAITVDPDQTNNAALDTTLIAEVADISSQKTLADEMVVGQVSTYVIEVVNHGPSVARRVQVIDNLPGGLSLITATAEQGSCRLYRGDVICNLGSMEVGQVVTIAIRVKVDEITLLRAAEASAAAQLRVAGSHGDEHGGSGGDGGALVEPDPLRLQASALPFGAPSEFPIDAAASALASGDLDGDGRDELVVGGAGRIEVFDAAGGGLATVAAGTGAAAISLADLDSDGDADLAVADRSGAIFAIAGNGRGGVADPIEVANLGEPADLAIGDVNGDQFADLVVSDPGAGEVGLALGDGDGGFADPVRFEAGESPRELELADLDDDGRAELLAASGETDQVTLLVPSQDGALEASTQFAIPGGPGRIEAADLNDDGLSDLAIASREGGAVEVLIGLGDDRFSPATRYAVPGVALSLRAGEFDDDGAVDLLVAGEDGAAAVLRGRGDGTFELPALIRSPEQGAPAVAAAGFGDLDGDRRLDLGLAGDGAVETLPGQGGADLTVSGGSPSVNGYRVVYPIGVENRGDEAAPGAALEAILPAGARLVRVGAESSVGCVDDAAIRCGLGTIGPGEAVELNLIASFAPASHGGRDDDPSGLGDGASGGEAEPLASVGSLKNKVQTSSAATDPDPGNDAASAVGEVVLPGHDPRTLGDHQSGYPQSSNGPSGGPQFDYITQYENRRYLRHRLPLTGYIGVPLLVLSALLLIAAAILRWSLLPTTVTTRRR